MIEKARKIEIAKQAHDLLEVFGYDFSAANFVSVIPIANKLGFKVVYGSSMNNEEQGFLAVSSNPPAIKLIGLNKEYPNSFQRFVIAHEIGHYILHYTDGTVILHKDKGAHNDMEDEANFFAANLLMPLEAFKKQKAEFESKGYTDKILEVSLSQHFRVEPESVRKRFSEVIESA